MTRILIADSDAASRKALALLLFRRLEVLEIEEARDIETIIRTLAVAACDLVLLDWHLHGAPAPQTCQLLLKAFPTLKIVLLSVDAENEKEALNVGAAFIHKGASPETVVATLKTLLKKP
jgi:DNA-binding NarL/FixJ family response regulator